MTAAPASASKLAWLKSASGSIKSALAGFAICEASWVNCWSAVASVASPLPVALGRAGRRECR